MGGIRLLTSDAVKFAIVGGAGLVVDITVFNILRASVLSDGTVPGAVLIAKSVATIAAIAMNWMGNRTWTFRDRLRGRVLAEALSFAAISVGGSTIALACLAVSHYVLGLTSPIADNISANAVGLVLGSIFRFIASRSWVFSGTDVPHRSASL